METKIEKPIPNTPIKASWGTAITDKVNHLNFSGGNGLALSQNGNGITISQIDKQGTKQATPQLFECRWNVVAGETQLYAYIGKNNAHTIVYRNSKPCQATTISDSDGWAMVAGVVPEQEPPAYVYVKISPTTATGGVKYTWELMATDEFVGTTDLAGDPERIAGASYVYIASYVDGVLQQWHVGEISTWYIYPDSKYPYNIGGFDSKSLDHVGTEAGLDIYQLYEFRNIDNQMDVAGMSDTAILNTDTEDGDKYKGLDFVMREWNAGLKAHLRYAAIEDVLAALGEALLYYTPVEPTEGTPYDHPFYGWETWISEHILEYMGGGDMEQWVTYILEESDKKYWHLGGNQDTCYGEAIGDLGKNTAISLAGRTLVTFGGDTVMSWDSCQLINRNNENVMDWNASQLINATTQNAVVDWSVCKALAMDSTVSIDWTNRQLINFAGINCVDWGSYKLRESAGVDVLIWDSCLLKNPADGTNTILWAYRRLVDDAGTTAIDWQNLEMFGGWKIKDGTGNILFDAGTKELKTGWKIDNLAIGGTGAQTFTSTQQISVVTSVNFGNQTTTTANIWVLVP